MVFSKILYVKSLGGPELSRARNTKKFAGMSHVLTVQQNRSNRAAEDPGRSYGIAKNNYYKNETKKFDGTTTTATANGRAQDLTHCHDGPTTRY